MHKHVFISCKHTNAIVLVYIFANVFYIVNYDFKFLLITCTDTHHLPYVHIFFIHVHFKKQSSLENVVYAEIKKVLPGMCTLLIYSMYDQ